MGFMESMRAEVSRRDWVKSLLLRRKLHTGPYQSVEGASLSLLLHIQVPNGPTTQRINSFLLVRPYGPHGYCPFTDMAREGPSAPIELANITQWSPLLARCC